MPVVVLLLAALSGGILTIWINIRILKKKVRRWTGGDLAALFVFSLGSFDQRRKELWTQRGFSEDEAKMILKRQSVCLFEMPIGFVVGCILSVFLSR